MKTKNAPESPGRCITWFGRSGRAGLHSVHPPDRLAVALAEQAELSLLFCGQVLVALSDVAHCVVEPVLLVLRQGIDNPTAENVTEQLVPRLGERCRLRGTSDRLLVHAPSSGNK